MEILPSKMGITDWKVTLLAILSGSGHMGLFCALESGEEESLEAVGELGA